MGGNRLHPLLEYLAEKSMGWENAPRGGNQLHGLVLERAALFPKSATKYNLCCYSKSGINYHHLFCVQINFERGL